MEKWQKDFFEMLETVADEVEQFFLGVNATVDALFEFSEDIAEQINNNLAGEIEHYLNEITEPFLDAYWELEDLTGDYEQQHLPYMVDPPPEKHPACIGCHHYHGQVYAGNLLVCAMHPYGWDDKDCPDWQTDRGEF